MRQRKVIPWDAHCFYTAFLTLGVLLYRAVRSLLDISNIEQKKMH